MKYYVRMDCPENSSGFSSGDDIFETNENNQIILPPSLVNKAIEHGFKVAVNQDTPQGTDAQTTKPEKTEETPDVKTQEKLMSKNK